MTTLILELVYLENFLFHTGIVSLMKDQGEFKVMIDWSLCKAFMLHVFVISFSSKKKILIKMTFLCEPLSLLQQFLS